jgi:hypothetical protein
LRLVSAFVGCSCFSMLFCHPATSLRFLMLFPSVSLQNIVSPVLPDSSH